MAFQVFEPLFTKIDTVTDTYVGQMSSQAAAQMTPVVGAGLGLTFIAFGLLIVRGAVQMPISEFIAKSIRIALIVGVALGGGLYQGQIADAIQHTPDELAAVLVPGAVPGQAASVLIDRAAGAGFDKTGDAWEKAGIFTEDGMVYALMGTIILVATCVFVAIGGAFLLLAKIALAVMAGLGPIFILGLLWQPTHRFFEVWVGQVVNYGLLVVLFAAVFGLMLNIFTGFVETVALDESSNAAYNIGAICILSIAMVVGLLQLPGLASALGGGASVGFLYEMRAMAGGAKATGKAGGAAVNAGVAGGKGIAAAASSGGGLGGRASAAGKAIAGHYRGRRAA